jgi:hypothetical protein
MYYRLIRLYTQTMGPNNYSLRNYYLKNLLMLQINLNLKRQRLF